MTPRSGTHRKYGRGRALVGLAVSGLLALGAGAVALAGDRFGQEAADRSLAEVDAQRLRVDTSFPGASCDYGGTYGYDAGDDVTQWGLGDDVVAAAVADTGLMRGGGVVRIHLTLPTTADQVSIDVRNVELEVDPAPRAPAWALLLEGCGGEQYSRDYVAWLEGGRSIVWVEDEIGELTQEPFEPFTVTPGETVNLTYDMTACDLATYEVTFDIEYVADTGTSRHVSVSAGSVSTEGAPSGYVVSVGELLELPEGMEPADLTYTCQ